MRTILFLVTFFLQASARRTETSGTFFQRISEDDTDSEFDSHLSGRFTKGFNQCSLEEDCNFFAVSNNDGKFYKAAKKEDLPKTGAKKQIWKKVKTVFNSCKEAMANGRHENGIVQLQWGNGSLLLVYCDMKTDGGGWIVFQKRHNSNVSFERDWNAYENGFGNLQGNFWLGLEALHYLTSYGNSTLRIDLKNSNGERGYAKYTDFKVGAKKEKYKITFSHYSGNVGDSMTRSKGYPFSTYDKDNDVASNYHCARYFRGGWWHSACYDAILNNLYPGTGVSKVSPKNADFMSWRLWKGTFGDIVFSEMKIKKEN